MSAPSIPALSRCCPRISPSSGGGGREGWPPTQEQAFLPRCPLSCGCRGASVPAKCGLPAQGLRFREALSQLTFVFSPQGNNRTSKQPPGPCLAEQRTWHDPFSLAICSAPFVTERGLRGKAEKPTAQIHPRRRPPALQDRIGGPRKAAHPHPFSGFSWRRVPRTRVESEGVGRPLPLRPGVGRPWWQPRRPARGPCPHSAL